MVKKSASNYILFVGGVALSMIVVAIIELMCHNADMCELFVCGAWISIVSALAWQPAANLRMSDLDDTSVPTNRTKTFFLAPISHEQEGEVFLGCDAVHKTEVDSACSNKTYYANVRNYELHYIDKAGQEVRYIILDELATTDRPRVKIKTIDASEKPRVVIQYGQYKSRKSRFWAQYPSRDYYTIYVPENAIGEIEF